MALRKFEITVDGEKYLVEMEEIGGVAPAAPVAAPAPAAVAPAPAVEETAPVAASAPAASAPAGADAITAPMPGTILKVLVNVGDAVTANQPIMILEAMKMENEIVAPQDGTVTGIHVNQGEMVQPGDALITIA
ncbi:acetyl-CoA carboxylase biotin carboxyl carrier protein subunit [Floricoccus penangensis]|uniref:Acetyl-CoA carboxylase biotin carboxyl carrier protein subunit n=1 Tax=Floricoccus penangensis TaxID=1859475 RepID=A0A9Q5NZE9_9LACT|nr:acetyl-CoA carboxylase biotin carboxyl carrier protein subunit [Floricoccus penangensis]OFI46489.1 acetyl-CoA carboxylase biotin carboxyl carrier protein subunit [Floricoccus penangensis]URZ87247.1 acetyl-CoA carboxylase biotin carboxyl carrier protein subunit [Floricoccus penangensis]